MLSGRRLLSLWSLFCVAAVVSAGFPKLRLIPACLANLDKDHGEGVATAATAARSASADGAQSKPIEDASCDAIRVSGGFVSDWAEDRIRTFLASPKASIGNFHIQGWRWHTLSLVRESQRLDALVQSQLRNPKQPDAAAKLQQASDYVIGFNLKGLHRIEEHTFFPWVKKKLTTARHPSGDTQQQEQLREAYGHVMERLEERRREVSNLGNSIAKKVERLSSMSDSKADDQYRIIQSIAVDSSALVANTSWMMDTENRLLVPSIAEVVDSKEQKSFSNKILMNLGLFDSRLHLVGMHEAVSSQPKEYDLFQQEIPYIPRMMIPRWKRSLYDPKVAALDAVAN